jgi:hypothetical protein
MHQEPPNIAERKRARNGGLCAAGQSRHRVSLSDSRRLTSHKVSLPNEAALWCDRYPDEPDRPWDVRREILLGHVPIGAGHDVWLTSGFTQAAARGGCAWYRSNLGSCRVPFQVHCPDTSVEVGTGGFHRDITCAADVSPVVEEQQLNYRLEAPSLLNEQKDCWCSLEDTRTVLIPLFDFPS